jgi:hypothetical protein
MDATLETRLSSVSDIRTQASIHLAVDGWSFTVSGILIHRDQNGKWRLTMPLSSFGENKRPVITLQGALKEAAFHALSADHQAMRGSGQRSFSRRHVFSGDLTSELGAGAGG